jgi:hypothetical protein
MRSSEGVGAGRGAGEGLVVPRVVDELETVVHDPLHEAGVGFGPGAGDAEGGADVVLLQEVEDLLGVAAVGAEVEGEGDLFGVVTVVVDLGAAGVVILWGLRPG